MNNSILKAGELVLNGLNVITEQISGNTKRLSDLKAALADLQLVAKQALDGVSVVLPIGTEPTPDYSLYSACSLVADINSERSKDGWVSALNTTKLKILTLLEEHTPVTGAVTRLAEIEQEIKEELEKAANATLKVGELLAEARDDFEKQDAFLVWAEEKFAIRKTQVFRLIKIYKAFNEDNRFEGVAIRVLDLLAGESDEVKEKAATLAQQGKLTTPELKAIIGGKEPEAKEVKEAAEEPAKVITEEPEQSSTDKALASISKQLQEALQLNAELNKRIAELTKPRQQALPLLPHFSSDNLAIRLGLVDGASAKEVRAAYRGIVKFYTPEANKQAYDLLTEAKDTLLSSLENKAA